MWNMRKGVNKMNEENMIEFDKKVNEEINQDSNSNISIITDENNLIEIHEKINNPTSLLKKTFGLAFVILKLIASVLLFGMASLYVLTWMGLSEITSALIASQLSVLFFGLVLYDFKVKKIIEGFKNRIDGEVIFQALKITMFVLIINTLLGSLVKIEGETSETVDNLVTEVSFIMSILLPIVVAPLFEEFAFRGGMKYVLIDKYGFSKLSYVIIVGVVFGLMHYSSGTLGLIHVALTGAMGIIYSISFLKTDNIYVPMISHLLYNGLIMLVAYIA